MLVPWAIVGWKHVDVSVWRQLVLRAARQQAERPWPNERLIWEAPTLSLVVTYRGASFSAQAYPGRWLYDGVERDTVVVSVGGVHQYPLGQRPVTELPAARVLSALRAELSDCVRWYFTTFVQPRMVAAS